ncbi:hypothetical protein [Actinomycetospora termitidis]|uniref:Uncharacterized protein n=1 Tax=Actinomycetospora termitidis TaxID=3053470 RepID=A0ABT7M623_9PSEU|nr:hypothetical protein [Actinomycetospora sp. Odt1-22]MDL5154918.1 hypothetical protein [Actinomycetospora sp. Odt1-22]
MSGRVVPVVAGALFVVYPALRPWGDATTAGMADAFASPLWLVAHLAAVAGFVLVGLGLRSYGRSAETVCWVGVALVLPYYGAEVFALHALGERMTGDALAATAEAIRLGPVAATLFAVGLVALAVAAVLVAVRDRTAVVFAVAMVAFLPQFFAPPAVRIAHGIVLGLGLALLAVPHRSPVGREALTASA